MGFLLVEILFVRVSLFIFHYSNQIDIGRKIESSSLWEILKNRISRLLRTHVLKFDVENLTNVGEVRRNSKSDAVEGKN